MMLSGEIRYMVFFGIFSYELSVLVKSMIFEIMLFMTSKQHASSIEIGFRWIYGFFTAKYSILRLQNVQ